MATANPQGSSYLYQTAVLKDHARPATERAQVSTEEAAMEYGEGRAKAEAFDARLGELDREFMENLLFSHQQLNDFAQQNDLASLVGIGNIATQGIAGYQQREALKKQDQTLQAILESNKNIGEIYRAGNEANARRWETRGTPPSGMDVMPPGMGIKAPADIMPQNETPSLAAVSKQGIGTIPANNPQSLQAVALPPGDPWFRPKSY